MLSPRSWLLAALLVFGVAPHASAIPFTVMTYNTKALPAEIVVGPGVVVPGNPDSPVTVPQIATALTNNIGTWDVVALQEAFDPGHYAALTAPSANTPPFDPPTNGRLGGSGLARLSQAPFANFARFMWTECGPNRQDCFSNKGLSFARHTVAGESLDIYNIHGDAGQDQEDRDARAAQMTQLANTINFFSGDNAVIVLGDTNGLYNRVDEAIGSFLTTMSLSDAWVELENGGIVPTAGSGPLAGCNNDAETDGEGCERIDKVLFRSGDRLSLTAIDYTVSDTLFRDAAMQQLSDHLPVQVTFDAVAVPEPGTGMLMLVGLLGLAVQRRN